jgi:hypothetical protein
MLTNSALPQQLSAKLYPVVSIHVHELYRRSASRRDAKDSGVSKHEMVEPMLPARVKKLDDRSRGRVDAGQIGTLASVAATARPGEILLPVAAAMLLRNDVFQVEGQMRISRLR